MKTIINPLDNKRYSIFSKQGKQILKSYVKIFNNQRGGANHQYALGELLPIDQENRERIRQLLLAQQRLRNQANQDGTYNPVGVRLPNNVMQNIANNFREPYNPFNYTQEQIQYINEHNLNIQDADENGNINCENCVDCRNCFNCRNCVGCNGCQNCEDCQRCYNCQNCIMCNDCRSCIDSNDLEICRMCVQCDTVAGSEDMVGNVNYASFLVRCEYSNDINYCMDCSELRYSSYCINVNDSSWCDNCQNCNRCGDCENIQNCNDIEFCKLPTLQEDILENCGNCQVLPIPDGGLNAWFLHTAALDANQNPIFL